MKESLGQKLVGEIGRFREALVQRVLRVNSLTESEVMKAGERLGKIVELATALSVRTRETLTGLSASDSGNNGAGLTESIARQRDTTETFITDLNTKISEQRRVASRAYQQSREILRAAKSVERLSQQSNIIALNAMVEAARMGENGTSFSVISNEMQRLSAEIKKTNTLVSGLAEELGSLLPEIAKMIEQTSDHADTFSDIIKNNIADVGARTESLQNGVAQLLSSNEKAVSSIVEVSQAALSYLQFQDTVAQGLLRMDGMTRKLQLRIGCMGGESMENIQTKDEAHTELGGDKEIAPDKSGEVMLF